MNERDYRELEPSYKPKIHQLNGNKSFKKKMKEGFFFKTHKILEGG